MEIREKEKISNLLKENIKNENLIKHSLAVGAAMKALANYFKEDEDKWEICGLLHDIDYEKTKNDPYSHSKLGAEMLKNLGFDKEIWEAVLTHNEAHGIKPQSKMAKALYCLDSLTGLIVASTLVLPSKKIKDLEIENILNRFKEKSFARGANREAIKKCEEYLGLSLKDFVKITLNAMKEIGNILGLE